MYIAITFREKVLSISGDTTGPAGDQPRRRQCAAGRTPLFSSESRAFLVSGDVESVFEGVTRMETKEIYMELTEKEKKLIELTRDTGYGEISLIIQDHQPVNIDKLIKKIKL